MKGAWESATRNLCASLPKRVRRWVIAFEPCYHSTLAGYLLQEIEPAEVIRLGHDRPRRVSAIAEAYAADAECGFLEFVFRDGRATHRGVDYRAALMQFACWPAERVRICFDVVDSNYCDLFSESPAAVIERCRKLRRRLRGERVFVLTSGDSSRVSIACQGVDWTVHSGLEPSDYLLPSGEVECRPISVDGEISLEGWIVGTIPFGLKFGRLDPGALRVGFSGSRVVEIGGRNRRLCRDLEAALRRVPGLDRVSEVGFGQSLAVKKAALSHEIGCLWHERYFGVHLGLGAGLVETEQERKVHHHLDLIVGRGRVTAETGRILFSW
jgi:hypothetical protein